MNEFGVIHLGTDKGLTLAGWIFFIVLIAIAAVAIIGPIVTVVNWHRAKNGKLPKGKLRNIIIVNKREQTREFYADSYPGVYRDLEPNRNFDGVLRLTSVDFRKVGGKILYTKSIDDELFDRVQVGGTYKVRIRDGVIVSIDSV